MKRRYPVIDIERTGQNIKYIMQMRGMTVKDLQTFLELSTPQSIYHWFDGRNLPTLDKEWKDKVYHDERVKQYASEKLRRQRRRWRERAIPEIRTSEFLRQDSWFTFRNTPEELQGKGNYYLSDDDRIYWWDGTDEVIISDDMDAWLAELSDRHRGLMDLPDAGCGNEFKGSDFIKDFFVLLDEICDYYKRIYPFKTMFYDFIQNSGKKEYRAALALLKMLYEENKEEGKVIKYAGYDWNSASKNVTQNIARLRLKRYLSVMTNVKMRKKYFNF